MKLLKILFYTIAAILAIVIIPIASSFGATFIGAIVSGFFGLLIVAFLISLPDCLIILFFPINHPWRIAAKRRSKL